MSVTSKRWVAAAVAERGSANAADAHDCGPDGVGGDAVTFVEPWSRPSPLRAVRSSNGTVAGVLAQLFGEPRVAIVEPAGTDVRVVVTASLFQRTTVAVRLIVIAALGAVMIAVAYRFTTSPGVVLGLGLIIGWVATTRSAFQLVAAGSGRGLRLTDVHATPRGYRVGMPAVGVLLDEVGQRTSLTAAHADLVERYAAIGFCDDDVADRKGRPVMTRPGTERSQTQLSIDAVLFGVAGGVATLVIASASAAATLAVVCLIAAAANDLLQLRLPNIYVAIVGVIALVTASSVPLAIISAVVAALIMVVARVGGGDVKYAAVGAALVSNPLAAAIAAVAALVIGISTRRATPRPLGPAIAVAIVGALTWKMTS